MKSFNELTEQEKLKRGKEAIICLLLLPASILSEGYVVMCIWNWFIVPGFHTQEISTLHGFGLSLLLYLTTYRTDTRFTEHYKEHALEHELHSFNIRLATFLIAYIASYWV